MPQLKSDAKPPAVSGARVKAGSRASGSASALALTRETGTATLVESGKKRSTSNTVAELVEGRLGPPGRSPPAFPSRSARRDPKPAPLSMRPEVECVTVCRRWYNIGCRNGSVP